MRLPDKQESKLLFWGGHTAIINTVKNNHVMLPIRFPMKGFFICPFGMYMTDTETEYRHNKQPLAFYISHGESMPQRIVTNVEKYYYQKQFRKCRKELEKIYPEILKGKDFVNIHDVFYAVVEKTKHFAVDLNTEKYLPYMEAYSPQAMKKLFEVSNIARKGIQQLSPPTLQKYLPLGLYLMIGLIAIAVVQNIPSWIREINVEIEKSAREGGFITGLIEFIQNSNLL